MRTFFLLFISTIICVTVSAQRSEVKFTTSKTFDLPGFSYPTSARPVSKDASYYIATDFKNSKTGEAYTIVRSDKATGAITTAEYDFEYKGKPMKYTNMVVLQDRLYLITSYYNKKQDNATMFGQEYDAKTLKPLGDLTILTSMSDLKGKADGTWRVLSSNDGKRLAVQSNYDPGKGENGYIEIRHFDTELAETNLVRPDLPASEKGELTIGISRLLNDGSVIIAIAEQAEETARDKHPEDTQIIFKVPLDGSTPQRLAYELSEHTLGSNHWELTPREQLFITGRYGTDDHPEVATGLYVKEFDLNAMEEVREIFVPLTAMEKGYGLVGAREGSDKRKDLKELTEYLRVGHLLPEADGGMFIVGAQEFVRTERSGNSNISIYNTRNVLVTHLMPSGEVDYITSVPMHVTFAMVTLGADEYGAEAVDGTVYLYFLDNPSNANQFGSKPSKTTALGKRRARMVSIAPDGQPREHAAYGEKLEKRSILYPATANLSADGAYISTFFSTRKGEAVIHRTVLK